jgi:hypothetical protein
MAQDREHVIDLELEREDYSKRVTRARLTLETSKSYNGGIRSIARVDWVGAGFVTHALGLGAGGDFSANVLRNTSARATQKAIDTQHARAFPPAVVDALTIQAKDYYATGKDKR